MPYPRPIGLGGGGGSGSGTGPITADRLPALRRRYARYDFTTPIIVNGDAGDFAPARNVETLNLPALADSSVLDRWNGNEHPWNIAGNYIDLSRISMTSPLKITVIERTDLYMINRWRLNLTNDAGVSQSTQIGFESSQGRSTGDVDPEGTNSGFSTAFDDLIIPGNATRAQLQYIRRDPNVFGEITGMVIYGDFVYE